VDKPLPFHAYPARERRPRLGAFLVVVGIGAPLVILAWGYAHALRTSFGQPLSDMDFGTLFISNAPLGIPLVIALFAVTAGAPPLVKRGLAYRQLGAIELLRRDARSPVLYLRSFDDDGTLDLTKSSFPWGSRKTIEMRIAKAFSEVGPVISIGRPGEPLPELGSNRFYVSDEEWQSAVLYFLEHAAAVIVLVGNSAGVAWEIRKALTRVPLKNLLFVFPFVVPKERCSRSLRIDEALRGAGGAKDAFSASMLRDMRAEQDARYQRLRDEYKAVSTAELPERLEDGIFLDFLVDGTPRVLPSRLPLFFRYRRDKQGVTLNYVRTLRPFLSKLAGREFKPSLTERFFATRLSLALFGFSLLSLTFGLVWVARNYELGYWGWGVVLVALMVFGMAAIAFKRAIEPISFVGVGKRFVASIVGFWLAGPVGWFVYIGGTSPASDDAAHAGLSWGFMFALAGMIAGAIAGLHGRIWMQILCVTAAGSALTMSVSALIGLPWQAADAMDMGDVLVLVLPILMVGGAVWSAVRRRRER
jgi:hypothetical protein